MERSEISQKREKELQEMDRVAKMLIRRDFVLTETREKREKELEVLQKRTKELEELREALTNMLEDVEEARRKIAAEENKTRAVFISLTDGLIVFDEDKKVTLVNPRAEEILGLKERQLQGRKIKENPQFPVLSKFSQLIDRPAKWTGQKYDLNLKEPTGQFFEVTVTSVIQGKEIIGLMAILHDVSREKQIARTKTEFISIAAHQLRTPLSATKWILKMLLDGDFGPLTSKQSEFATKGYEINERMIDLVNDLLDVARIEEGKFGIEFTQQNFNEFLRETVDSFQQQADMKKIELKCNIPDVPLIAQFDSLKLQMAIANLIKNAIDYTPVRGRVRITSSIEGNAVKVAIKDTGVGIPQQQQKRIFSKFFRGDNAIRMQTEGTGLGLYLAKNIIEKHGGKVWFESEEGKGTTFWFTLPITRRKI